jgi:hypothetical protein
MRRRDENGKFIKEDDGDTLELPIGKKKIFACIILCCLSCCCFVPWVLIILRMDLLSSVGNFLENQIKCPPCQPCEIPKVEKKNGF